MVLHMPWDQNLGAPRVQIELANELRAWGHTVDKFDWRDAFPKEPSRVVQALGPSFATRAARFVRSVAERYDVVEAQQGNLPFSKARLGLDGLLVARSCGLYRFYFDFERYARCRWPEARGRWLGRLARLYASRRAESSQRRSLLQADLINVPNADELAFVRDELGLGDRCVLVPNGVQSGRLDALGERAAPAADRLARPEVVFVGHRSLRKGSADWGAIAARIRQDIPAVRLKFLGTGVGEPRVLRDLGQERTDAITVVPRFESQELPGLLRSATVGVLPSYVEGFGLGVVEQLAAGIPTVAYDAPGARQTLAPLDRELLTPCGDPRALGARATQLMRLPVDEYALLSERCMHAARRYSLEPLARATLDAYTDALARLR